MYPPEKEALPGGAAFLHEEVRQMGPLSPLEWRSIALFGVGLGLWMTDFIHHIPSPMIGLGVGLATLIPRVGVLNVEDVKKVSLLPVFFVASAISMAHVLEETKALAILTDVLFAWTQPFMANVWTSTGVLYWSAFVYHIVIGDEISMLATSLPMLMNYAKTAGLDPLAIGMVWTFSAGGKIFLYQSAVLVVGYSVRVFYRSGSVPRGSGVDDRRVVDSDAAGSALLAAHRDLRPTSGVDDYLRPSNARRKSSFVRRMVRPQRRRSVGASSQRASGP